MSGEAVEATMRDDGDVIANGEAPTPVAGDASMDKDALLGGSGDGDGGDGGSGAGPSAPDEHGDNGDRVGPAAKRARTTASPPRRIDNEDDAGNGDGDGEVGDDGNDGGGDDDKGEPSNSSPISNGTALVPQLSEYNISESDLQTAVRVLEAVSNLDPTAQRRRRSRAQRRQNKGNKGQTDGDDGDGGGGGGGGEEPAAAANGDANAAAKTNGDSTYKHNDDEDPLEPYKRRNLRPFRKALSLCLDLHRKTQYAGKTESDHYAQRHANRTLKRQKMAERTHQKKYIADTALRKGRVEKLKALQDAAKEEEEGKMEWLKLMVPDGHVDTGASAITGGAHRMIENGDAGGADGHVASTTAVAEAEEKSATASSTTAGEKEGERKENGDLAASAADGDVPSAGPAAAAYDNDNDGIANAENATDNNIRLPKLRSCYVCKIRYRDLHYFYDQLCPPCASLNYTKRHQTADLTGKVAVVTGSRVKIGYQVCLKLLRAGCTVVATTRFPNGAASSYRKENDFDAWKHRLHVYGLDLRDVTGLEAFTRFLKLQYGQGGIDILINNACQTVRRPGGYYRPLVEREQELWDKADEVHRTMMGGCADFERVRRRLVLEHSSRDDGGKGAAMLPQPPATDVASAGQQGIGGDGVGPPEDVPLLQMGAGAVSTSAATPTPPSSGTGDHAMTTASSSSAKTNDAASSTLVASAPTASAAAAATTAPFETTGVSHSAAMSQWVVVPEDVGVDPSVLPPGLSDVNGQQLDLRHTNSWLLKMDEVSTPEVMECMFVNAIAPFVLNSRLTPLMSIPPTSNRPDRYIINVSAMEGKFYRYKMPNHPHTNMAKAALNMLTRTSSEDLAKRSRIYMNSVDTGWINDENPLEKASKIAQTNLFQTPIDEIDAAARILDPVFVGVIADAEAASAAAADRKDGGGGGGGGGPTKGAAAAKTKTKKKEYGKFFKDYRETEW